MAAPSTVSCTRNSGISSCGAMQTMRPSRGSARFTAIVEGIASSTAILAHIGGRLEDASPSDLIWTIEADYLGQLCAHPVLGHSPQRILIGGGVMRERLYREIHERMLRWLGGYIGVRSCTRAIT